VSLFTGASSIYGPACQHHGTITTASVAAAGDLLLGTSNGGASAAWPAANRAIFVPFEFATPRVVTQLFWHNGAIVSGNVDCGLYQTDGTLIVAVGGVAQSGTSTIQVADITDTLLLAGLYVMALSIDNTTAQILRSSGPGTITMTAGGIRTAASSYPLPSPATIATTSASNYLPMFGFAFHATV
jgi:hypothetical protein